MIDPRMERDAKTVLYKRTSLSTPVAIPDLHELVYTMKGVLWVRCYNHKVLDGVPSSAIIMNLIGSQSYESARYLEVNDATHELFIMPQKHENWKPILCKLFNPLEYELVLFSRKPE